MGTPHAVKLGTRQLSKESLCRAGRQARETARHRQGAASRGCSCSVRLCQSCSVGTGARQVGPGGLMRRLPGGMFCHKDWTNYMGSRWSLMPKSPCKSNHSTQCRAHDALPNSSRQGTQSHINMIAGYGTYLPPCSADGTLRGVTGFVARLD